MKGRILPPQNETGVNVAFQNPLKTQQRPITPPPPVFLSVFPALFLSSPVHGLISQ